MHNLLDVNHDFSTLFLRRKKQNKAKNKQIYFVFVSGKKLHGAPGTNTKKRALENQKRAPENCHRLQCKSLFNDADLVNGM